MFKTPFLLSGHTGPVLSNQDVLAGGTAPQTATYELNSNGIAYTQVTGLSAFPVPGQWVIPHDKASDYEAMMTPISGTFSSVTTGSWLDLASTWDWTRTSGGPLQVASGLLEIRKKGTLTVLASATITLEAEPV